MSALKLLQSAALGTLLLVSVQAASNTQANQIQSVNDSLVYVPIILHVLYSSEEENLTLAQINSQIDILNQDFRAKNTDLFQVDQTFSALTADLKIEFFLADTSLNDSNRGIHRVAVNSQVFIPSNIFSYEFGGVDPIEPERFLNVWVARLQEGLLGFNSNSGVAINYLNFGTIGTATPYNLGRTLTHELGHYFSLDHLWGTGGCSSDDGIEDTPIQDQPVNNCQEANSCGSKDMVQNFMNLGPDDCLLFFTHGQKSQVRSFLTSQKALLLRNELPEVVLSTPNRVEQRLQVYPNPSSNRIIQIDLQKDQQRSALIYSLSGKCLRQLTIQDDKIDMRNLPAGAYIITIHTGRKYESVKVILQ